MNTNTIYVLCIKIIIFFRKTKDLTKSYVLAIFDFECMICKEELNNDMQCQSCGKRICVNCVTRLSMYDGYRCPMCRQDLLR